MTYDDALDYIHNINARGGRKRALAETAALLAKLGSPEKKLKFVHVTGTNGKGSTCAFIESILRSAGLKTGLFTSPFINRFNERIRVSGEDIPDKELAALLEHVKPVIEAEKTKPSEFELVTILGLVYFMEQRCDIVIMEVGVGGERDATNVIPVPETAVITAIGLDHTRSLGRSIEDIARAKAGIIKAGGTAVIYGAAPEAEEVIKSRCDSMGAELIKTDFSSLSIISHDLTGCRFDYKQFRGLTIPLAGTYQPYNAAVAITTVEVLRKKNWPISDEDIRAGLAGTRWQGRFELLRREPVFILDGGHNPQAVAATVKSMRENFPTGRIIFLTGVMADKDVDGIISALVQADGIYITVSVGTARSLPAEEYAKLMRAHGLEAEPAGSIADGVRRAMELAGADGVVCALGSLYISKSVREAVESI